MKIIVNQPFGIGDCIFSMTLVKKIADGREIIWPVLKHFVEGLNRAYPTVRFVDWQTFQINYDNRKQYEFEHHIEGRCTVLPVRWTTENMGLPYSDCMKSKYLHWGMDFEDWREEAMWVRDIAHEEAFASQEYMMQNINGSAPHVFVNTIFGSDAKMRIAIPKQLNQIELFQRPNYSLFDWVHIVENASAIHTVSTSIIYLLEMLDLKAPEVHLYNRPIKGQGFDNIDYLLKRHKYVFHG